MAPSFNIKSTSLQSSIGTITSFANQGGNLSQFGISDINSIMAFAQQLEQGGDEGAAVQSGINIIQQIASKIISMRGNNQQAQANQEVKQGEQKAKETDEKAKMTAKEIEAKLNTLNSNVDASVANIEQKLQELEQLGGDQGLVEEARKQLDEQLNVIEEEQKIINENVSIINNGVSSPEAKKEALNEINGSILLIEQASNMISSLSMQLASSTDKINELTESIDSEVGNITDSASQFTELVGYANQNTQALAQELGIQQSQAQAGEGAGQTQEKAGDVEIQAGNALKSNTFTYTKGVKLEQNGKDTKGAGQTRIQGYSNILSSLQGTLGTMNQNLGNISTLAEQFVGKVGNASNLLGEYSSKVDPLISAFGAWEKVTEGNEEFKTYVTDYKSQLSAISGEDNQTTQWQPAATQTSNATGYSLVNQKPQAANANQTNANQKQNQNNSQEQGQTLTQFQFEMKKLQFGI